MALPTVGSVAGATPSPALETGKEKFGKVMEAAQKGGREGGPSAQNEVTPRQVVDGAHRPEGVKKADAGCATATPGASQARAPGKVQAPQTARGVEAAKILDQVAAAQKRMDHILEMAQAGKSFTPAELIAMQAQVHRASQELDLAGKVVEKATGGVKQVLQTQV